jgi:GntR family transcriptional regulator / MocR family aminotransferase
MRIPFAAAGARVLPVGVDTEGLIVEQLPPDARVVCLCPSHQFPLGVTLSVQRRKELVAFAQRNGAVIIEDDYDGEFRYEGSPVEALWSSDAAEHVFYVGTFSKCMLPALRLGFIVAPQWAMRTLVAAKNCLDWHTATPVQIAVARFISEGHLARHVRKMREVYRGRRELLLRSLVEELDRWLIPSPSFYGLHVAAVARAHVDVQRVTDTLLRNNVKMHDLTRYFLGRPTQAGIVLGYGVADLPELRRGIALLRRAFQRVDS